MFRWKRALLHGLIPFVLVIGAGLAVLAITHPADPEKAGESTGTFAAFAYLAGFGISWLAQTGRRTAARLSALGLGLVIAGVFTAGVVARRAPSHMPELDRAPLVDKVVAGAHRLVHPTYGFSILRPPASFHEAPELAAQAGLTRDVKSQYYVFSEEPMSSILVVGLLTDLPSSRDSFADAVAGMRKAFTDVTAAKIITDETTGSDGHLMTKFHATIAGAHVQIRAYQTQPPGMPSGAVMVMTTTADGTTLGDVLDSFTP